MNTTVAPQSNGALRARGALAAALAAVATSALFVAGVGLLDHFAGASERGQAMLRWGGPAGLACAVAALLVAPRTRRARARLAIVALGVFPFATFGAFLLWRVGVSAEQLAACEAGDGAACRDLAERKERRGRPEEAAPLLVAGCEHDDGRACTALAIQDPAHPEAETRMQRGCELGVALACVELANDATDTTARLALLGKACDLGDASACERARLDRAARGRSPTPEPGDRAR